MGYPYDAVAPDEKDKRIGVLEEAIRQHRASNKPMAYTPADRKLYKVIETESDRAVAAQGHVLGDRPVPDEREADDG